MSLNGRLNKFQRFVRLRQKSLKQTDARIINRDTRESLLKHYHREMLINYGESLIQ